jgi:hypothetical protein
VTLRDAADYITSLPKKESDLPEWQTAIEVLMLVSRSGTTMMARIGVMKALAVNLLSAWLLRDTHGHHHDHGHSHEHHHHDNNLRAAYVHVLADAATSILAIAGARGSDVCAMGLGRSGGRAHRQHRNRQLGLRIDPLLRR